MLCLVKGLEGREADGVSVCLCVCTAWQEKGGRRWTGGSYLFVLPSRRVREQIKGFSWWGAGGSGGLADLKLSGHLHPRSLMKANEREQVREIKTLSFLSGKSHRSATRQTRSSFLFGRSMRGRVGGLGGRKTKTGSHVLTQ